MSLFEQFELDTNKETEGIWIKYAPNSDGSIPAFRIKRMGPTNLQWTKTFEREVAPYRRLLDTGNLDPVTSRKVMIRTFCTAVLIEWEHVQRKNGEKVEYSFNNAVSLMLELPELFSDLSNQAQNLALFRLGEMEQEAKNS